MKTSLLLKALCAVLGILLIVVLPVAGDDHDHDHDHDHGHGHAYEGPPAYYTAEHGDFEIGYEDGELELHIHLHAGAVVDGNALHEDTGFEPDQLTVVATEEAEILRPAGELWEPTGVEVNEPFWVLPQHGQEGLPAYGFATEEIPSGVFVDDVVGLNLRHIKGPGDFSLWQSDAFGVPSFALSTHEELLSAAFPIGLHAHYNWGFTAPGEYTMVFEATGELVAGGQVEALSVYYFKVTEEHSCIKPLAADVNGDCRVDFLDIGHLASQWLEPHSHDHSHDHSH